MDEKAFFKLSYGLYLVSSRMGERDCGCVINTLTQVTATPARVTIAVNRDNYTTSAIESSGVFSAVVLTQDAPMELIGAFGFHSSSDTDKFASVAHQTDGNGVKYVTEHVAARLSCKVIGKMDAGTHVIFLGEVQEAEILSDGEVMTYSYYHTVKKGRTPPKASSYSPAQPEKRGWRCKVCGYVYEGEKLPEDFICPICGVPADQFEQI